MTIRQGSVGINCMRLELLQLRYTASTVIGYDTSRYSPDIGTQ
jgi:hypothetical protein